MWWLDGDPDGDQHLLRVLAACAPDWQRDALCVEYPTVDWFADDPDHIAAAVTICGRCLVRADCLGYALDQTIAYGVWGGTTPTGRRGLLRGAARRRRGEDWRLAAMRAERASGATLAAIGERHGISRQRVAQLLADPVAGTDDTAPT